MDLKKCKKLKLLKNKINLVLFNIFKFFKAYDTLQYEWDSSNVESENKNVTKCNIEIKPHRGCDDSNMFVPTSDQKGKKYCCIYCLKRYQKLERHLRTVHKNEVDVKKFRALPPRKIFFLF